MLFDFLSQLFHLQFYFLKGLQLLQLLYSMLFLKLFWFLSFLMQKNLDHYFLLVVLQYLLFSFFNFFFILSLSDSRSYSFTHTHSLCSIEYLLFLYILSLMHCFLANSGSNNSSEYIPQALYYFQFCLQNFLFSENIENCNSYLLLNTNHLPIHILHPCVSWKFKFIKFTLCFWMCSECQD